MSEPFVGEIRIFGFNWAPLDWARCDGSLLPINQYNTLYALLGTTFGGDGVTTFGIPDLRGRAAMGATSQYHQGLKGGYETVSLAANQLPAHTHTLNASNDQADNVSPASNYLAQVPPVGRSRNMYAAAQNLVNMHANSISITGGGLPHNNMQPFLAISYCIALAGIFPQRA